VSIILQSTVGGFSAEFMRKLPQLEQAMIAHGLEPSQFVISKDRATPGDGAVDRAVLLRLHGVRRRREFHRHRAGRNQVPGFFLPRCIAQDDAASVPQRGRSGLISRIFRWMTRPI
jgi:hypothetical protein